MAAGMTDADIHAFGAPVAAGRPSARPRRPARWLALVLFAGFVALMLAVAFGAWAVSELVAGSGAGVTLNVDGESFQLGPLSGLQGLGMLAALAAVLAVALTTVLLAVLVVVPLALGAALLAAALGVGIALLAALGSVALALSPLLLPVLLLWWLLRRRPAVAPGAP